MYYYFQYPAARSLELIDTQWDVNIENYDRYEDISTELIDTQWDVNEVKAVLEKCGLIELIDTQWDVNLRIGVISREMFFIVILLHWCNFELFYYNPIFCKHVSLTC